MHGVPYYRCYHKGDPDKYLQGNGGKAVPCPIPEVKTGLLDTEAWDTICGLIRDPELLIKKLRYHNEVSSQTKEALEQELIICRNRLKSIPGERKRLVEGYRKGLYPDAVMREEMDVINKEQSEFEARIAKLGKQLSIRTLTDNQEGTTRRMVARINNNLDGLDFRSKQRLLRLLVDRIIYDGHRLTIQTIIPLEEQLCPIDRGGLRG